MIHIYLKNRVDTSPNVALCSPRRGYHHEKPNEFARSRRSTGNLHREELFWFTVKWNFAGSKIVSRSI